MKKYLVCYPEKCTGCGLCEFACSLHKEQKVQPSLSRIRCVRMEPAPAIAMACLLCEDPTCVRTCVKNAITQDEATGVISVDENKCTGCSWCALTCEFGAIHINPERKVAVACDLCDGDPRCVKICPHDALRFEPLEALYEKKREKAAIFYLLQKESKAD